MQDHLLVSNEHNNDSPNLSNKLDYAQKKDQFNKLRAGDKSHEHLQKRKNGYPDLKQGGSVASGSVHMDFSYGTCDKQQTVSVEKFQQGSDYTQQKRVPQSTTKTASDPRRIVSGISEQMSAATIMVNNSKFNVESMMEEEKLRITDMTPNQINTELDYVKVPTARF